MLTASPFAIQTFAEPVRCLSQCSGFRVFFLWTLLLASACDSNSTDHRAESVIESGPAMASDIQANTVSGEQPPGTPNSGPGAWQPVEVIQGQLKLARDGFSDLDVPFSLPFPLADSFNSDLVLAFPQVLAETQTILSNNRRPVATGHGLSLAEFRHYQSHLPNQSLFCGVQEGSKWEGVVDQLGGFQRKYIVNVEPDATSPRFQRGWTSMLQDIGPFDGILARAEGAAATELPDIQRPNLVAKNYSTAFYLSSLHGLVTVDLNAQDDDAACALPLPGVAQNFVLLDEHLYVIVRGIGSQRGSGLLKFDIRSGIPELVDSLLLSDAFIRDARAFNDTLVLYGELLSAEQGAVAFRRLSHSPDQGLFVVATQPKMALTHTETLPAAPEPLFNRTDSEREPVGNVEQFSRFESFVSASGEYLIVPEFVTERELVRYNNENWRRCVDYSTEQRPFESCSTLWKRLENPDFRPIISLSCPSDLRTCLNEQLSSVNRYVYVPDGQQCEVRQRTHYTCKEYKSEVTERPHYKYSSNTHLHVYRFSQGEFLRLAPDMVDMTGITPEESPFQVPGRVLKHDHMQFQGNRLYVVASSDLASNLNLHTFKVRENAVAQTHVLPLLSPGNHSNVSAQFTSESIYLSENRGLREDTQVRRISLADPLAPALVSTNAFPADINQLFVVDHQLLAVGQVSVAVADASDQRFNTLTSFDTLGEERGSFILGTDYWHSARGLGSDDQMITLDAEHQRMFLPLSLSGPIANMDAPLRDFRLSGMGFGNGQLSQLFDISLPEPVKRTLSLTEESVLALSDRYVHRLDRRGDWRAQTLFSGALPKSMYFARNYPVHVQHYDRPDYFEFRLIDSPEHAAAEVLDEIRIPRASSQACSLEQVFFDRDRLLVVHERSGVYFSSMDCPEDRAEIEKVYTGYRFDDQAFSRITDNAEMERLYQEAQLNLVCVFDTQSEEGSWRVLPEDLPQNLSGDDLHCIEQSVINSWRIEGKRPDEELIR